MLKMYPITTGGRVGDATCKHHIEASRVRYFMPDNCETVTGRINKQTTNTSYCQKSLR